MVAHRDVKSSLVVVKGHAVARLQRNGWEVCGAVLCCAALRRAVRTIDMWIDMVVNRHRTRVEQRSTSERPISTEYEM